MTLSHAGPAPIPLPLPAAHMPQGPPKSPIKTWDVYVENFIGMAQGNQNHHRHVKCVLLHALDPVFLKLDPMGWIVDTLAMTIEPPPYG
jgi:hypothetical protein